MHLTLMRHGDTGRASYRGQIDDVLSATGWEQSRAAVVGRDWDIVISSSLRRCSEFADELTQSRALPLLLEPRLIEYGFGDWQGRPIAELELSDGKALHRYWRDPAQHPPPGAESFAGFAQRICTALDDAVVLAHGRRVLVITHGAVIRWLRCHLEQRSFAEMVGTDVPNASLHTIDWPAAMAHVAATACT